MKTSTLVALFAVFSAFAIFSWIHYEYAKTPSGYNFWFYGGCVGATALAVITAIVGIATQKGKK